MVILTLGETTAFPMIPAIVNQLTPLSEKGRYQGILNALIAVGKAIGPLAGGMVIERLSYRPLFEICMGVGLLVTVVVTVVTYHRQSQVVHY